MSLRHLLTAAFTATFDEEDALEHVCGKVHVVQMRYHSITPIVKRGNR